jgi:hypothetical protein
VTSWPHLEIRKWRHYILEDHDERVELATKINKQRLLDYVKDLTLLIC